MSGLALKVGGFGGVGTTAGDPAYGTPQSYSTVTQAAFGPGVTAPVASTGDVLAPDDGFGLALWVGVGSIVLLCLIRHSLPR